MNIATERLLLDEINSSFPFVDMPTIDELVVHQFGCKECEWLRADVEAYRNKSIDDSLFRLLHQELRNISEKTFLWIAPHYLKYCISFEGQYSGMETEFLVYAFSPSNDFYTETIEHYSFLNGAQVICLSHFIEWCIKNPNYCDFSDYLQSAQIFLTDLAACVSQSR